MLIKSGERRVPRKRVARGVARGLLGFRGFRGGFRDRGSAEGVPRWVARRGLARGLSSSWTLNSIVFVGGSRFFKLPCFRERVVLFEVIGC